MGAIITESVARVEVYPLTSPVNHPPQQQQSQREARDAADRQRQLQHEYARLEAERQRLAAQAERERQERLLLERERAERTLLDREREARERALEQDRLLLAQQRERDERVQREREQAIWLREQQAQLQRERQQVQERDLLERARAAREQEELRRRQAQTYHQSSPQPAWRQTQSEVDLRQQQPQVHRIPVQHVHHPEQQAVARSPHNTFVQQNFYRPPTQTEYLVDPEEVGRPHFYRTQHELVDSYQQQPQYHEMFRRQNQQQQPQAGAGAQQQGAAGAGAGGKQPGMNGSAAPAPKGAAAANGTVAAANGSAAAAAGRKPPTFLVQPQTVTVKAGDQVMFTAKASGDPLPQISFLRADGKPLAAGRIRTEVFADGSARMTVDKVEAGDADTYVCIAKNPAGSIQARFGLTIMEAATSAPPTFVTRFQSVSLYEGDSVKLYCKANAENAEFTWYQDDKKIASGGPHFKIETKGAETALCISDVTMAEEAATSAPPTFVTRFQSVSLYEGDSVKLYCKANAENAEFTWYQDDKKIASGGPHFKIETKGAETALCISDVTMAEGGWYRCDATNAHGTTQLKGRVVVQSRAKLGQNQREQITLRKVDRRNARSPAMQMDLSQSKSAPAFLGSLQSAQLVEGQTARLEVKFGPQDDPNLKIAWLKDGRAILASSRVVTVSDFGVALLEISPVTGADAGEYTVVAVNPLGECRQSAILNIIGHGRGQAMPQQAGAFGGSAYAAPGTGGQQHIDLPNFLTELRSQELFDGSNLHLEAKLVPINDPSLKVEWFLNGKPMAAGGRVQQQYMHGFATLDIAEISMADAGTITARAFNAVGASENSADIVVHPRHNLVQSGGRPLDVEDVRELQFAHSKNDEAPRFLSNLVDYYCPEELGRSYFEAAITPVNDPSLKVTWLKDGHPLPNANRIQTNHNFGRVSLVLHPTYPEDHGMYSCVLHSVHGKAQSQAQLKTSQTPALQTDTRHEGSMQIIGYLDGHQVHIGPQAVERPEEFHSLEAPRFARALATRVEAHENEPVHFEARLQPASDVKMTVEWYHNGAPLPAAHRFRPMFDFGYVALDILYAYPEDSGVYELVARNELGETRCQLELVVTGDKVQYLDPHHPESLSRIEQLEQNRMRGLPEIEDRGCDSAPQFIGDLRDIAINEHEDIHLDLRVSPINDPTMKVEWFVNGAPLLTGSRVKALYELGFVALDIKGAISEDSGTYVCRLTNALGEASKQCQITVAPSGTILSDTQHEESLGKINYLENLNKYDRVEVEDVGPDSAPVFVVNMPASLGEIEEGEQVHLECQIKPYNDNSLRVQWLKDGHPLPNGHRFRTFYDFGFVSLDILGVTPQDAGTYVCHAVNALGEAKTDAQFTNPEPETMSNLSYATEREIRDIPIRLVDNTPLGPVQARARAYEESGHLIPVNVLRRAPPVKQHATIITSAPRIVPTLRRMPEMVPAAYDGLPMRERIVLRPLNARQVPVVREEQAVRKPFAEPNGTIPEPAASREVPIRFDQGSRYGMQQPQDNGTIPQPVREVPISYQGAPYRMPEPEPKPEPTREVPITFDQSSRFRMPQPEPKIPTSEAPRYHTPPHHHHHLHKPSPQLRVDSSSRFRSEQPREVTLPIRVLEEQQQQLLQQAEDRRIPPLQRTPSAPRTIIDLPIRFHSNARQAPVSPRLVNDVPPVMRPYSVLNQMTKGGAQTGGARTPNGTRMGLLSLIGSAKDAIVGHSQHPSSYAKIQEMEAPKPAAPEAPEQERTAPSFVKQLGPAVNVLEGDSVYLEAQCVPTDDNSMTYEWLLNGAPLMKSHRYALSYDFGYVALNILYCFPEDSGEYTLVVRNEKGEARSTVQIECEKKGALFTDSFHPNSIQKIHQLEQPMMRAEPLPDVERVAPTIPLPSSFPTVHESQTLHLEAQISPIDDNTLIAYWMKDGAPLPASSRYRILNDFGFASLDIDYIRADDAGTYSLVVRNDKGQAETSTSFEVDRLKGIISDTAHPESLRRIQEIEALKPALPSEADAPPEAPSFSQQLSGPTDVLKEGQSVHMDCVVQPINDPNLKIEWFFNGAPLAFGSRIRMIHDFGYVGLEFLHVHPEDSGVYECRATNAAGTASTELQIECKPLRNLYLDTQHAESWAKIQEIENRQDIRPPTPEQTFEPPTFTVQLVGADNLPEASGIRLECRLIPVNDPTLRVMWTRNGQHLPQASRFMPRRDVDLCTLDILAIYGEDNGEYACHARSDFGEAVTTCNVTCIPTDALLLDTQHEQSWQQIQEFENRQKPEPIVEEAEKVAPQFTVPLAGSLGELAEGVPIHLECQVAPTNDNQLTVQWYHNGAPISHGHRFRTTHDFGYVALDILYAFAQDSGEWACVARNELGEAQTMVAPKFVEPMASLERIEFQQAHFETRVTPVNDPRLRIQWFKDGAPLPNSNRFKLTNDFGFVALDIAHTVDNDSGTYTVVASNEKGEDTISASLLVVANPSILGNTQHEQSWARIQALEAPRGPGEERPEAVHEATRWVRPLNSVDGLVEGQPAHFEAQFTPFGDPKTTVHWFLNGRPMGMSNRKIMRNEFGLVTLDLAYTLAEDAGEYMVLVRNDSGEDTTAGQLACSSRPGILGDVQHEQSWKRIQEIEAPRAPLPEPAAATYQKPSFTQPLQSVELPEGGTALLEARFIPVNDPSMTLQWFLNDQPLADSNWITMTQDFGCAALKISPAYARHTGVYSCKATNSEGAAITSAQVTVHGEDSLFLDTQHPASLQKIREMEAIDKYARLEAPEREFDKPQWIQPFADVDNVGEGQVVELHGLVEPSGDPSMRIEWLFNGKPILNANRYRQEYEFGNAILTIAHTFPHDTGVYTCRAWNNQGEASTSATVKIDGYERLLLDSAHPVSWQRIQELEAPKIVEEIEEVVQKEKPYFLTQLASVQDIPEGEPVHLEATFMPARDPDLKVEWQKNGAPIGASQLVKTRHELGWATLDILSVNPDHNGMYTLHIANDQGEAASSASVKVAGTDAVLRETRHEESWKRIQILEAPREPAPDAPAPVYDTPQIKTAIADVECSEGEPAHFEATIEPINDPGLKVEWLRNGQPLAHGNKYAISHDFGICILDIGYAYPEDQGVYQLRIWNDAGEAVSSATLKCQGKDALLLDTQHQESWRRIQEIEAPRPALEEVEAAPKPAPKFISPLAAPPELFEGQPAHFETTVEPIDDPNMTITWFLNGQPIAASSRAKMINDFGWVIMDIGSVDGRDSGDWACVAKNAAGEAQVSTSLNVLTRDGIAYDSLQPQSLQRIQEIEAPKPLPEELPAPIAQQPQITAQLVISGGSEEGSSAHLEAQYTPINDPNVKVEWFRNGQPLHHSNRYKMVHDFGFAILEILSVLSHDAGEYTLRVSNEAGEASTSATIDVETKSGLLLQPMNEANARAVEELEEYRNRRPEEIVDEFKEVVPVFIEPLSAPVICDEGDRAHFTARYEPVNDNQLQVQWFLNGAPLKTGARVKPISDFGFCVLQISPVYPEDSGEYSCRAVNRVGEAVTSTKLECKPKEGIISRSQLPERMSGAAKRIAEIEAPRPARPDAPDVDHGPPKFLTQIQSPPELLEGQIAHLEAQIEPVADPRLKVEWLKDGFPMPNSARMKMTTDFGFVVLDLCPAEPQDTGKWTCRISNQNGQAESECEIKVVGQSGVSYEWMSPDQRKERITELENWIHRPKDDLQLPQQEFEAPRFTTELSDLGQLNEADATAFVCVLEPIGDPTMRIEWQHNGHAIPYSNRIMQTNEFGVATLLIKHLIAADSGEYRCIASTSKGRVETVGNVVVESITQQDAPAVVQPLVDTIDGTAEGESIHLECRVTPIHDPLLKVRWYKNGAPLPEASRFRPSFEFGFVSLDILYAYPEDNGDYELVAENGKGEARTKTRITVLPGKRLEFGAQAHGTVQDNLESHFRQHTAAPLALKAEDIFDESAARAPVFLTPLVNIGVEEGDFARFETQVAPVNDPYMKLEWYKDKKPVLIGHRFRSTLDFGFACLDLLYALPDDTGEYTCVATNKFGQTMTSAKLGCSTGKHIITDRQLPQGLRVSGVKKDQGKLYWSEQDGAQQQKQRQVPEFTIKPRPLQVTENEVARFECALIGVPKPKVTWYINGNQALHGHRHKLHYDGIHYLTIQNCRISDAGEILVVARNTEGEVQATASLDVFQNNDFRQHKLKPTQFVTANEMEQRAATWKKETMGKLGEAFETAPKADPQKLMHVERSRTPIEPMESEELINKFMRPKEDLYEHLSMVEQEKKQFKGLELEPVSLKAGKITRFTPEKEDMEKVNLRSRPKDKRLETPPREVNVPARDQVNLKLAKPTRASEVNEGGHVRIEEDKAKLRGVQQGREVPKEEAVIHKDQVVNQGESVKIEEKSLKESTVNVKPTIPESTISNKLLYQTYRERRESATSSSGNLDHSSDSLNDETTGVTRLQYHTFSPRVRERTVGFHMIRPTPTKLGQSAKAPVSVSQQLKPVQAEIGKPARFFVAFEGALPIKVTWFRDGKELKPTFETQIKTTNTGSTMDIGRLKATQAGEYMVRLENVAGQVESSASLSVTQAVDKGKAPDFSARMNDLRIQQGAPATFQCTVTGEPVPTISWFKDGAPLPNDGRFTASSSGGSHSLAVAQTLPQDVGVYECVAKNAAGEARCKARLNVNLVKTGKGAEEGPRLEAPRFTAQIQPVIANEGGAATFTAKFTGSPDPMIRWYRNNEPIKKSSAYVVSQSNGEATLKIEAARQEDVAEYKVEASNPAGKASSVANLVLAPKAGRIAGTTVTRGGSSATASGAPQFVTKLSDVSARQGHTVKFTAEIAGNPLPTVKWTHNGRPLVASPTCKITLTGNKSVVELARVGAAQAGDYVCSIENNGGSASCQAKLTLAAR
ncbi:ketn-1 [Pristionchus pacificus]|uniref:Ketn-1 n=1 Tax=Pristionchus pacificus TaxID=54126 RepID=A0A2A6C1B7_PRIPA|nr:ketn-1 [Pristionchus pacificus]|eukprot:PDM71964.1 ketn-1 [Pristionchus pacificus]